MEPGHEGGSGSGVGSLQTLQGEPPLGAQDKQSARTASPRANAVEEAGDARLRGASPQLRGGLRRSLVWTAVGTHGTRVLATLA